MISLDDVKLIQSRFSDAADRYERLAFIQNDIRRELLERLATEKGLTILDVGCGTGALVSDLAEKDPGSYRVGVDLAWGMVERACQADGAGHFLQADGIRLPFRTESFERVLSSSSYQWAKDLKGSFAEAHRVLKRGGTFQAALFGQKTLGELWESLHESSSSVQRSFSGIAKLPTEKDVSAALKVAGFKDAVVSSEIRCIIFRDLWAILWWLKSIGANGMGRGIFMGKKALQKAQEHYGSRYGAEQGLVVTFEIIWLEGKKTA